MTTIEDCLEKLDHANWDPPRGPDGQPLSISNTWDRRFIADVSYHTRQSNPLSAAQGQLALKLIQRYRVHLEAMGVLGLSVDALRGNACDYRIPPRNTVQIPREVRYVGSNTLAFRCRYNPLVVEDIKKLRGIRHFAAPDQASPRFEKTYKLWLVEVNSGNLDKVQSVISRHRFNFDDRVAEFIMEATNARNMRSTVEIKGDEILVTAKDDDLLATWLLDVTSLEFTNV